MATLTDLLRLLPAPAIATTERARVEAKARKIVTVLLKTVMMVHTTGSTNGPLGYQTIHKIEMTTAVDATDHLTSNDLIRESAASTVARFATGTALTGCALERTATCVEHVGAVTMHERW